MSIFATARPVTLCICALGLAGALVASTPGVVDASGTLNSAAMAWGDNSLGELGNGTAVSDDLAGPVSSIVDVREVAAGGLDSYALLSSGKVMSWGINDQGQLGDESFTGPDSCTSADTAYACSKSPVRVKGLRNVTALAGGESHTLALLSNGTVMAWGDNVAGELGDGTSSGPDLCANSDPCSTAPVPVSDLKNVVSIAAGQMSSMALLSNGTVMVWGDDRTGQLGSGNLAGPQLCSDEYACAFTPVAVSGLHGVKAIAAGDEFDLALLSDGTVMAWGTNFYGELGNGTTTGPDIGFATPCNPTPEPVSSIDDARGIAAGGHDGLALLKGGSVVDWGYGDYGQLGDGSYDNSDVPVAVQNLTKVVAITAGEDHNLALRRNGAVSGWGSNQSGQLGIGSFSYGSNVPVSVNGLVPARSIAAGLSQSLANP
jgi:alpha-tubulin suppressor-like RCC1 family protein